VLCATLMIGLFAVAISNAAYEATSPSWLTFHVLLRKAYSVVAFALIGFVLSRTLHASRSLSSVLRIALAVGLYSAFIEFGQWLYSGAHETLAQQSVDVAAGLIGGAIGAALSGRVRPAL
jgi:hypothetical protein